MVGGIVVVVVFAVSIPPQVLLLWEASPSTLFLLFCFVFVVVIY